MTRKRSFRIGTRGSRLALWQAERVSALISSAFPDVAPSIVKIRTTGDRIQNAPFAQIGGKGVFVKEIEEALLDGRIDIAVHSLKDMPVELPPGLALTGVLARQSPLDALCARGGRTLSSLPPSARVGTSSTRRTAQLLHLRPDIEVVPVRGNVDTRLRKLETEGLDAVVLAYAGLERMGLESAATEVLDPDLMLPAPGQGIVALEGREDDETAARIAAAICDRPTLVVAQAERAFLKRVGGGCQAPVGCLATLEDGGDTIAVRGLVATTDGARIAREEASGPAAEHVGVARRAAEGVLERGGGDILRQIYSDT